MKAEFSLEKYNYLNSKHDVKKYNTNSVCYCYDKDLNAVGALGYSSAGIIFLLT